MLVQATRLPSTLTFSRRPTHLTMPDQAFEPPVRALAPVGAVERHQRWLVTLMLCTAIAISYLDRQTLPWALQAIQADIPFSHSVKAALDSAFLLTYGLMYVGGGMLLDRLGTRRGFILIMMFWSLACASHGFAGGVAMLVVSRLLLGVGEGGGFPAATRAVSEWFAPKDRATAMGIINGGTAIGAVIAPPLIALILTQVNWLGLAPWRWVFFITGAFGFAWTLWWWHSYRGTPGQQVEDSAHGQPVPLRSMLARREVRAIVLAKFLSDGAWYFYIFWLPKYLFDAFQLDIKTAGAVGWIPYAAAGIGALLGGGLSSWLIRKGHSLDHSRKIALGLSALLMPWVMLAPHVESVALVLFLFSLAFFGQQSWSTLVMVLPTDLIPRRSVGTLAGLVGLGGALGGISVGTLAGWMRDLGYSYEPVLLLTGSMHLLAFIVICVFIRTIQPLSFSPRTPA
jgi:ACS family hexuronate transporter-like MFS transporter